MKKFLLKASMVLLLPIMLVGCGSEENKSSKESGKVEVTASISPIKEFTELIGGDKIEVTSLVPDNAEPHDIDLKPRDFEKLTKSKLFIYNGLEELGFMFLRISICYYSITIFFYKIFKKYLLDSSKLF